MRSKSFLIKQQKALQAKQAKKEGKTYREIDFSFSQFPDGSTFQLVILLVVLGLAMFVVPMVIPDLGSGYFKSKAVSSALKFAITNSVHKGTYKTSTSSGVAQPDQEATFMAVSILTKNKGNSLPEEETTRDYVNQLEETDFNRNTKEIYQGIVQLKGLGILDDPSIFQQYSNKYYNHLLQLTERHSAFRLNALRSASVSATFYAFQAIKELGKMELFKKTEEFGAAIHFVASMKDTESGGFREVTGVNATVEATYHAVRILAENEGETETIARAFADVPRFLFNCQVKDGGFLNQPGSTEDLYFKHSPVHTTCQALYVLEFFVRTGKLSLSVTDAPFSHHYNAINYLRIAVHSLNHGVLGEYPSDESSLKAAFYFLELVNDFPSITYGIPRELQNALVGIGCFLIFYAIFVFYSPQVEGRTYTLRKEVKIVFVLLVLSGLCLRIVPQLAVLAYLALAMHIAVKFYEAVNTDHTGDGLMVMIALAQAFCYLGMAVGFTYMSPLVFSNIQVYYILGVWQVIVTFFITIVACYMTEIKKVFFFINTGYVAWALNTILFYSYLYGKGEFDNAYRLIVVHGHFPGIFVFLPFLTLGLTYCVSAAAAALYMSYYADVYDSDDEESDQDVPLLENKPDSDDESESESESDDSS
eukprot:CAMPEP_0174263602 /NCGR_PEP_ID=MMETSP0439-20130205/19298_1 /TAXON_ID=0 /ORGANISM="Stereomyxa ramosa, Strain Chinc5" /LENGTH=646 /DNA_ID=CAMNT_0015349027 /DNA_START=57 /DNA_END=1997 /DNA_ORIENTATION=+